MNLSSSLEQQSDEALKKLEQQSEEAVKNLEQPLDKVEESPEKHEEIVHKIEPKNKLEFQHLEDENGLWSMDFDGNLEKYGAGIGIWVRNPFHQQSKVPTNVRLCSYNLAFDCTNNEAEYEALIIGLNILKEQEGLLCMVIQNL